MKKIIYLFPVILIISACRNHNEQQSGSQDSGPSTQPKASSSTTPQKQAPLIDNCGMCADTAKHNIDPCDAAILIREFQLTKKFKNCTSGGTIWTKNPNEDKIVDNALKAFLDYSTFRFHYCSVQSDDVSHQESPEMDIYLAFDRGKCTAGRRSIGIYNARCLVPDLKNTFKKFSDEELENPDHFCEILKDDQHDFNDYKYLLVDSTEVKEKKSNLISSKLFANDIHCNDYAGDFDNKALYEILHPATGEVYGWRYYFGIDEKQSLTNDIRVILVGIGKDGKNLKEFRETSTPHDYWK